MLEITADDISRLNDEQLRDVVARLCEAEVRKAGHSSAFVTYGGNQNAPDGGIDVRVSLPIGSTIGGYVPAPVTGFQVKKQDMARSDIIKEMCPKGRLRQSIRSLIEQKGAYLIVSSQSSVSGPFLEDRLLAMRDALRGVPGCETALVDFYDRTRIASWLREHECLVPWVRKLVGRPVEGWQSYGTWAYSPESSKSYLLDSRLRLQPPKRDIDGGLTALEGIKQIRKQLGEVKSVVRLIGLSGVGKTRLVQALFESEVGGESLDPSKALYTNIEDGPDPHPASMASQLVLSGTRAILIVDNCSPELHRGVSEICRRPESSLSLITVEYDIREDAPEGTEVFILDTSSAELIEKLIQRRFPAISQVDRHTIADFSGGNARIAIALAGTLEGNESLAGLNDGELFRRLFWQRHSETQDLYRAAQICSLVYSFQVEDTSGPEGGELSKLGKLSGQTPEHLFGYIAELKRRGLVQRRDVWRAVLPQAVANRLAALALQNVPYSAIKSHLFGSERLLKSFSRRLGYLHESSEAVEIVRGWLAPGGLLASVGSLDEHGRTLFENVAPTAPKEALSALQRTLSEQINDDLAGQYKHFLKLLRSIAYDAALFEGAVTIMTSILAVGSIDRKAHDIKMFSSLFYSRFSGTRATLEQRLAVLTTLLKAHDENRQKLGVIGLKAAMEYLHPSPTADSSFGARSRDFGSHPKSREDVQHWYRLVIEVVRAFALGNSKVANGVREAFSRQLRGLWLSGSADEEITSVATAINSDQFWPEGWLAVRQILDRDRQALDELSLERLKGLEALLCPKGLVEKVRSVVIASHFHTMDLADEDSSGLSYGDKMARTDNLARQLGKGVAQDQESLSQLLPEIFTSTSRLVSLFGQGLAEGAKDPEELWHRLTSGFAQTENANFQPALLWGYLHQLEQTNRPLLNYLLDSTVQDPLLSLSYPYLETACTIDAAGVNRLRRSLAFDKATAACYRSLSGGTATNPIPPQDLKEIVLAIAAKPSGHEVASGILSMRIHDHLDSEPEPELVEAGRELLRTLAFCKKDDHEDFDLGQIASFCLRGSGAEQVAHDICRNARAALLKRRTQSCYHNDLLGAIFQAQPLAALDAFYSGDSNEAERVIAAFSDLRDSKDLFATAPLRDLLDWCDGHPNQRYRFLANIAPIVSGSTDSAKFRMSDVARALCERAPDSGQILRVFLTRLANRDGFGLPNPGSAEVGLMLLDELSKEPRLSIIIDVERSQFLEAIERKQQDLEQEFSWQGSESFE